MSLGLIWTLERTPALKDTMFLQNRYSSTLLFSITGTKFLSEYKIINLSDFFFDIFFVFHSFSICLKPVETKKGNLQCNSKFYVPKLCLKLFVQNQGQNTPIGYIYIYNNIYIISLFLFLN